MFFLWSYLTCYTHINKSGQDSHKKTFSVLHQFQARLEARSYQLLYNLLLITNYLTICWKIFAIQTNLSLMSFQVIIDSKIVKFTAELAGTSKDMAGYGTLHYILWLLFCRWKQSNYSVAITILLFIFLSHFEIKLSCVNFNYLCECRIVTKHRLLVKFTCWEGSDHRLSRSLGKQQQMVFRSHHTIIWYLNRTCMKW